MSPNLAALGYLVAGVCFILALRGLSHPSTSRSGNRFGMIGMAIAILVAIFSLRHAGFGTYLLIVIGLVVGGGIGFVVAKKIEMTAMPQLVAAFHSLVGLAAVFVAAAAFLNPGDFGILKADGTIKGLSLFEMGLGTIIGAITFTGSVIAFGKLQAKLPPAIESRLGALKGPITTVMSSKPIMLPGRHAINIGIAALIVLILIWFVSAESGFAFLLMTLLAFAIGVLLIIPIGGADMPVVVSMLNSYSGWAAAGIGFTLQNPALIITGALVGSSGAILSYIMCKAMNRGFLSVIAGGFGAEAASGDGEAKEQRPWKRGSAEDAAFLLGEAENVIIIPGYGMAVAQAQHVLREMGDLLKEKGVNVKYAIHPVAGRMPGHMNVLLAEANVPYDEVFELEDINSEFAQADVAFIIGANDVVNPAAKTDKSSPIYGMPVFDVDKAKTVMFIKRSMGGVGYAGVDNDVFYMDQTMMLLADAKKMVEEIIKAL